MGFLLGLPLRLLGLIFGLIRFLIPLVLLVLVGRWLWRRDGQSGMPRTRRWNGPWNRNSLFWTIRRTARCPLDTKPVGRQ